MKRNLQNMAMQLSEAELHEMLRFKQKGDQKKIAVLTRKRAKLMADLKRVESQLQEAGIGDGATLPVAAPQGRRGRKKGSKNKVAAVPAQTAPAKPGKKRGPKPGKKAAAKIAAQAPAGARRGRRTRNTAGDATNFSAAVRDVFLRAGTPLRARQVVEALPDVGVKVEDPLEMRKRVSVLLAQHKKYFTPVERGVYQLKQD